MPNISPATVTVTAPTGPGLSVTAKVFNNVTKFEVDFVKNTLSLEYQGAGGTTYFSYSNMATLTWTITAGATAIVVSS